MRLRTRILLFLIVIAAAFIGAISLIRRTETQRFEEMANRRVADWSEAVADYLALEQAPLATMTRHYSAQEGLVAAIADGDHAFIAQRITREALGGYNANAVWVYDSGFKPVYSVRNFGAGPVAGLPLAPEAIASAFGQNRAAHFFFALSDIDGDESRLMEVQGATVHPGWDTTRRKTEPEGYLFAGRLLDAERLLEMARITGNKVALVKPGSLAMERDPRKLLFVQPLPGPDGQPVALLQVARDSPDFREMGVRNNQVFLWLIGLTLLLFLVLSLFLLRSINRPLRRMTRSLATGDLSMIRGLERSQSEFGEMARLISRFYEQRENLVREMQERVKTQEALRESEERLRHAQKLESLGRMAGGVAHDFNNLLTAIIGYAELLVRGVRGNSNLTEYSRLILGAGERAAGLTRQLLAFSRKQALSPRIIDLNALIAGLEKLLRRIIGEHVEIETHLEANPARVRADRTQIEQVVLNLGVNARDAMPGGGRLTLRTETMIWETEAGSELPELQAGRYVVLSVTDTGEGMNNETRQRIFEPFFTTKTPGKGTGLGLATVYGVVQQSGGAISVESEPGCGSTFRIFLPAQIASVEEEPELLPPQRGSAPSETILLAEDEEVVRELMHRVLVAQGYRVLCASSGIEAVRVASEQPAKIDLLITDVIMPQMNGRALSERLRVRYPELRVLYVSGYSRYDMSDQGLIEEEMELLTKPFSPEVLERRVREVIEKS